MPPVHSPREAHLLEHIRRLGADFSLKGYARELGFKTSYVGELLNRLVTDGKIRRVSRACYEVIERAPRKASHAAVTESSIAAPSKDQLMSGRSPTPRRRLYDFEGTSP